MREDYIQIQDLTKKYTLKTGEEILALNKVNLNVKEHEVFGLVGPNGAGKTTLIKILCTLLQPTTGSIFIDGLNIKDNLYAIRRKVGVMFDSGIAYPEMSGYKNLRFWAKIYRIENYKEKINEILEQLDLVKWTNEIVANYSLGMTLKIAVGRLLLTNPAIWILDEPTRGMDVHALQTTKQILKSRKEENTIIVTSHDLTIMDKLCDRIAIIDQGKILAVDTPENLKILQGENIVVNVEIMEKVEELERELNAEKDFSQVKKTDHGISVTLTHKNLYPSLFTILKKFPVTSIDEKKRSLEDIFLKLTKK